MADVHTPAIRSYNMSKIRSKNTQPEMLVRKYLFAHGFRYRLHRKDLPGNPDIVLPKYHTVIFVNGCFWHGHEQCKYFVIPKTKTEWWVNKINRNIYLDTENIKKLKANKWNVITIFGCALKKKTIDGTMLELIKNLKNFIQ